MAESNKTEEVKSKKVEKSSDKKNSIFKRIGTFWTGLKAEFGKISFPTKETVGKQTLAVVVVCVIVSALIAVLDYGFEAGLNFLQSL